MEQSKLINRRTTWMTILDSIAEIRIGQFLLKHTVPIEPKRMIVAETVACQLIAFVNQNGIAAQTI